MSREESTQAPRQGSRILRLLYFGLFRFVPLLLLLGIVWSGFRLLQGVAQQSADVNLAESRREFYIGTATAIAPTPEANTSSQARQKRSVRDISAQVFVTNTPQVEIVPATPAPAGSYNFGPALPTILPPADPQEGLTAPTAIPTRVPLIPRDYTLINILLLGSDEEVVGSDNTIRTDVMIIVSINLDTGTVKLLSLPRDLFVYIPSGTMQRINTTFGIGEQIGWTDGGFGLMRQTIFYNLGLNVHYYAKVNFTGFEQIIDLLGGVDVPVDCAYQDYYLEGGIYNPELSQEENYKLRTLDIGYYTMNGYDALWYARTRKSSDDFDRGRRQQQILRAIWHKGRSVVDLGNFSTFWGQISGLIETDMPASDIANLLPLALSLTPSQIDHYTLIRTYHTTPWQTPDQDFVQLPNYDPIHDLLLDFYQPPTSSQLSLAGPSILVKNGTANSNWDRVASERLSWEGFNAVFGGNADQTEFANTLLIDYTGDDKNSLSGPIARVLNIRPENIRVEPNPGRQFDYEVILGADYNSCTYGVIQPGS